MVMSFFSSKQKDGAPYFFHPIQSTEIRWLGRKRNSVAAIFNQIPTTLWFHNHDTHTIETLQIVCDLDN